jgi:hypothetical protein
VLLLLLGAAVNARGLLQHALQPLPHALLQAVIQRLAAVAVNHNQRHVTAACCGHCAAGDHVNACLQQQQHQVNRQTVHRQGQYVISAAEWYMV